MWPIAGATTARAASEPAPAIADTAAVVESLAAVASAAAVAAAAVAAVVDLDQRLVLAMISVAFERACSMSISVAYVRSVVEEGKLQMRVCDV